MNRKCKLREMKESDLEMVLLWRNKDEIRKNMYTYDIIDMETHIKWYQKCNEDSSVKNFIFEKEGSPCGFVAFTNICPKNQRSSWAFYSGDLSVKGIGPLMEVLALEYAFEELKLNKLCCEVLDFNETVIKFHKKFGFEEEGVFKRHYWKDGQVHDVHLLAFFKENWSSVKTKYFKIFKNELGASK